MALVTCFDPEGVEYQKEPVDARECVKHCGFTLTPPESKPAGSDSSLDSSTADAPVAPTAKAGKIGQK